MHNWREYIREHLPTLEVGPQRENTIVSELALQMEQTYTEGLSGGAPEPEALRRAQGQFGDWQALARAINAAERPAERELESGKGGILSGAAKDIRYAARFLGRNPAFAAIAVSTLA